MTELVASSSSRVNCFAGFPGICTKKEDWRVLPPSFTWMHPEETPTEAYVDSLDLCRVSTYLYSFLASHSWIDRIEDFVPSFFSFFFSPD